ncbi:hypothetical protein FWH09_02000 [Candidatus Saccharibacteria bacterium]|nr:hypothetical protein [Candidatus Saccharibacteria bacterium]
MNKDGQNNETNGAAPGGAQPAQQPMGAGPNLGATQPTPPSPAPVPQPVVPPQPTAQSTMQPQTTPVAEQTQFLSGQNHPEPTKKEFVEVGLTPKKPLNKKLLFGIIGGVVVALILVSLALWFFLVRQDPVRMTNNAIYRAVSSRNIAVSGQMNYTFTDGGSPIKSLVIDIDSESAILPSTGSTYLVMLDQNDNEYRLKLMDVFQRNGEIYIRVDELRDTYDKLIEQMVAELPGGFDEIVMNIETPLLKLVDEIDGQWWRISARDLVEMAEGDEQIADQYNCAISAVNRLLENGTVPKEIADIYMENPFVTGRRQDGLYKVGVDEARLNSAMRAMNNTRLASEMMGCFGEEAEDMGYITIDQSNFPEILLDISYFSHRLDSVQINYSGDGFRLGVDFAISYPSSVDVATPRDSRSILDLGDLVHELLEELGLMTVMPDEEEGEHEVDDTEVVRRDRQRRADMEWLVVAINLYQADNRGRLPNAWGSCGTGVDNEGATGFCRDYAVDGQSFADPNGEAYSLIYDGNSAQNSTRTLEFNEMNRVYITRNTVCESRDGSVLVDVSIDSNRVAVRYALEGGGVVCLDN